MNRRGLFVGLLGLDIIYQVERLPSANEKITALDCVIAAGGPAANAAVTFAALGGQATLAAVVGQHVTSELVRADLRDWQIRICDLEPDCRRPLPLSSALSTAGTGDRAVVSLNARRLQADATLLPLALLDEIQVVLIDGHQLAASQAIASQARARQIPVVLDGGSWKPGLDTILPAVDYAVCSADFFPPGCQTADAVVAYLSAQGVGQIAITAGDRPIQYWQQDEAGVIPVPTVKAVDTLGAGDIFHGAFCAYIGAQDFPEALSSAAAIAAPLLPVSRHTCWVASAAPGLMARSACYNLA
ncbi:MAG: sugar kinase, partial [Spirulinaceae cyanobacterium RM2_2_10]|nr:sugar kinase [Spirulinaceae cyanobacterium RM2_2_10]